jgi:hypothetical protein
MKEEQKAVWEFNFLVASFRLFLELKERTV